uniref:Uncharacterized protein n=1 Tax=Aegilops tauschii subsp. strangulata TaxID=200361 RepID=A0A453JPJ2_AEGTS
MQSEGSSQRRLMCTALGFSCWRLSVEGGTPTPDCLSKISSSLKDGFSTDEAHKFLKIGLLCTQDSPKVRPSMSTVAKMLKGECPVGDKIMRPGLITDVMDLASAGSTVIRDSP